MLRDDSYDRECRLEMYPNEKRWIEAKTPKRLVIDLRHVTYIEEYRESRTFPYALTLMRGGLAPIVVGTDTETELREWVVAIQLLVFKSLAKHRLHNTASCGVLPASLSFSLSDSFTRKGSRESLWSTGTNRGACSPVNGGRGSPSSSSCPPTPSRGRLASVTQLQLISAW